MCNIMFSLSFGACLSLRLLELNVSVIRVFLVSSILLPEECLVLAYHCVCIVEHVVCHV